MLFLMVEMGMALSVSNQIKLGEIRIRRNTGPVRCIGYCIACIWGDPFVCNTDPGLKALKGNRWDPGF